MAIVTRIAKGAPLEHSELDNNFIELDTRTSQNTSNIAVLQTASGQHEARLNAAEGTIEEQEAFRLLAEPKFLKMPVVVAQLNSPVKRVTDNLSDTTYLVLASITVRCADIPMGPHSILKLETDFDFTNSTNEKRIAIDWGGLNIALPQYTSASHYSAKLLTVIANTGSLKTQTLHNGTAYSTGFASHITTSADTSGDVVIDIKARWTSLLAAGSEYVTLLGYSLVHYPSPHDN